MRNIDIIRVINRLPDILSRIDIKGDWRDWERAYNRYVSAKNNRDLMKVVVAEECARLKVKKTKFYDVMQALNDVVEL